MPLILIKRIECHDFGIRNILARCGLHMNLNESCGTDAFLVQSCPAVVQALYLLSLKLTFKCISDIDDMDIDLTCFSLQIVFSQR
jgi:hypothetical protein